MYLYHLQRTDAVKRDERRAVVVCALDEDHARGRAAIDCGNEGELVWLGKFVTCQRIGQADDDVHFGVVVADVFCA